MSKHILRGMIIACVFLLSGCGSDQRGQITMDHYPSTVVPENKEEQPVVQNSADELQTEEKIYVVISVNTKKRLIGLGLPDSLRTVQYGYTKATQIMDDHGQFVSASKLQPGRTVTIGELDDEAKLTSIQLASRTWYQENITRFSIDPSIGMFVIGDTKYRYNEYLRAFSGDQEISLMQIKDGDVISVQGLDKQILSVQVTQGHGTIALTNTKLFEGGWISFGTKIYARVTPNMTIEVPEGTYELSVANDGYGDSKTVKVERAQVTTVDLDEYRGEGPKLCKVTFEVHVEDALLYINGEETAYDQPVELRYGVYRLTVIADGFETWERQLVIHSPEAAIQIGEPQLSESAKDTKKTDDKEDQNRSDEEGETGYNSRIEDTDDDSSGDSSEETVTDGPEESRGDDYGDYLDTIVDLIESLAARRN